jgi:hypothetical protein
MRSRDGYLPDDRALLEDVHGNIISINEIPIRRWELNENSTHYDYMIAAPADSELVQFWTGWSVIMLVTGVFITVLLIPIVSTAKVRKNPFNVYLIFLMIPDVLVAWICGFTCLSNAIAGHFTSSFMCYFQSFYMIAAIGTNSWLNVCVTRQLYIMLNAARLFQRHELPSHRQVIKEAAFVYIYSLFLATLAMFDAPWWPHKTRMTIGAACVPMDYDTASTVFFYCVFFPLLFGIPLAYVCWVAYQIYKHKMLPPAGRRRILSIYFFRLAAVFVIMWLPGLLFLFVTSAWLDPWVQWAGGAWSHLQGLASAMVSLLKPDIWKAVRDFWCCTSDEVLIGHPTGPSGPGRSSSIVTKRPWFNSSVYWSSMIGLGLSSNKPDQPTKSRVSSYHLDDDELEIKAMQCMSRLENKSHLLVSDDSVLLDPEAARDSEQVQNPDTEIPDGVAENHNEFMEHIPPPSDRDVAAPVGTIYIVPKKCCDNSKPTTPQESEVESVDNSLFEPVEGSQFEPVESSQFEPDDSIPSSMAEMQDQEQPR